MGFVDDVDLVARRCGREHRALTQIAGVVHASVTRSIELDDVDGARSTRSRSTQLWHDPHGSGLVPARSSAIAP